MKRCYCTIVVLVSVFLSACMPSEEPVKPETNGETQAIESVKSTEETGQVPSTEPSDAASQTEHTSCLTEDAPYTIALDASIPIFDGPSYDHVYARTVGEDGVFTIVEVESDGEGNHWGKLKSGAGWVDLTYVHMFSESPPRLTVSFLENPAGGMDDYHLHIAEDSEYTQKLLFRPRETLDDVQFAALTFGDASYETDTLLYAVDTLTPEKPVVLGVVFHGDMTTYGVTFTDNTGTVHRYAIYISGRNGMLIVDEY